MLASRTCSGDVMFEIDSANVRAPDVREQYLQHGLFAAART